MTFDPADRDAVAAALVASATDRLGLPVATTEFERVQGGLDNLVWFVALSGDHLDDEWRRPLVLRIRPTADRAPDADRESAVQRWVEAAGFPAASVVASIDACDRFPLPAQLAVRAQGRALIVELTARPLAIRRTIRRFAALHARLHALSPEEWPGVIGTARSQRLASVRRQLDVTPDAELSAALARVERLDLAPGGRPLVPCHGDFHPLNIVSGGSSDVVIDWTDATLDDATSDVARAHVLFHVAAIAGRSRFERALLRALGPLLARWYLRAYAQHNPVDHERLAMWEAVHLLQGWAQICGVRANSFASASAPESIPDPVFRFIRSSLQRRLAGLGV